MLLKKIRKKTWFILLVTILFSFFLLASQAKADYTPPKRISSSVFYSTIYPQLAPDIDGYLHLTWMETNQWFSYPNPGIFYSRWNGDTWSTPVKISQEISCWAQLPSIAVDANKIVHVVYDDDSELGGWQTRIRYTKRELGGQWSSPTSLPHPTSFFYTAFASKITVDTSNNLHVVYGVIDDSTRGGSLYYTKYDVSGGSWSDPLRVSYDTDGVTPTLDSQWGEIYADKQGNVHLIYWDWPKGIFYRKLEGGIWSTPIYVIAAPDIEFTKLTVDDNGNPFVAWFQAMNESVWVRRTENQVWQAPELLSTEARRSLWGLGIVAITTNSKNIIAAGWLEEGSPVPGRHYLYDVVYRYYSQGIWSEPDHVRVDRPWPDSPFLIRDKWDNQHIVWSEAASFDDYKSDLWYSVVQGTQTMVGPAGGTVTVNPGGTTLVTLDFESGALSADTLITALIGPLPESVSPGVVTVPRAFTFGPSGLTFPAGKNPTIVFTYTDTELEGADPKSLESYVWDSVTSSYQSRTGKVNTDLKTLTVTSIDHFSLFAMAAKRVFTRFLWPFKPGMEINQGSIVPLRFRLLYSDKTPAPEGEVVVQLKQGETVLREFRKGKGLLDIKYDPNKGTYWLAVPTRGLSLGEYQLLIFYDGPKMAETNFKVVLSGEGLNFDKSELNFEAGEE